MSRSFKKNAIIKSGGGKSERVIANRKYRKKTKTAILKEKENLPLSLLTFLQTLYHMIKMLILV